MLINRNEHTRKDRIMRIGLNINIDVTKLDKGRFFTGKKGTYADLTTFVDLDNEGQYGDNGTVSQKGAKGEKMPIIGNVKVFWRDDEADVPSRTNDKHDDLDVPF
jgi:hypothetical protein